MRTYSTVENSNYRALYFQGRSLPTAEAQHGSGLKPLATCKVTVGKQNFTNEGSGM